MNQPEQSSYQNNPFFVALDGLKAFFAHAESVAIAAIVLSALAFISQGAQTALNIGSGSYTKVNQQAATAEQTQVFKKWHDTVASFSASDFVVIALIIGTLLFIVILIGIVISGVADYTSSRLARGEKTTLAEALKVVFSHIGSYLWLQIIIGVKILLWSLLFIVPGIIMAVRYSLAGVSFFEDDKRGNEAVKHSLALTKGAWLTTFASVALWNIITFGMIKPLLRPGTNAVLYRQFKALEHTNVSKPPAHIISWLTLIVPIVIGVLLLLLLMALAVAFRFS